MTDRAWWAIVGFLGSAVACVQDKLPAQRETQARQAAATPATAESAGDPRLSAAVAAQLAAAFERSGVRASVQGAAVRTARHGIVATVQEDQVLPHGDATLAAINVRLKLDEQPIAAFSTSATALDANRDEALAHAVREWAVGCGMPIVAAIEGADPHPDAGRESNDTYVLGQYRVYPGPTGVRGEIPQGWVHSATLVHASMLQRIEPAMHDLVRPSLATAFHSLKIVLHVRNGAAGEGECRVDGDLSERLCQLARSYPWPQEAGDYILKQYYVLGPGHAAGVAAW